MDILVQHHVKYKEIHGVDEIILMEKGAHRALHNRLRREGKCKIPPSKLSVISAKAQKRSPRSKEYKKIYDKTPKAREYYKRTFKRVTFYETLCENVRLCEEIIFNINTENVRYGAVFQATNGRELLVYDI